MLPPEGSALDPRNVIHWGAVNESRKGENLYHQHITIQESDHRDPSNHPIENIYGIGQHYSERLRDAGITTIGDIAKITDIEEFEELLMIPGKTLRKIRLRALSRLSGEIIQTTPFEFPGDRLIYLDVETDDRCTRVWLIGILVDGRFTQLYANTWDEERTILERFLDFLDNHHGYTLVTYSGTGFDTRVTIKAARRLGLESSTLQHYPHIDLCSLLRRCFIFPHHSYSLKELGSHLQYGFKQQELDGLRVAKAYQRHIESGLPIEARVFEYNEDDVKVVHHLVNHCFQLSKHTRSHHPGYLHVYPGHVIIRTKLDPWLLDAHTHDAKLRGIDVDRMRPSRARLAFSK
jgi:predicted RecB family nuclease